MNFKSDKYEPWSAIRKAKTNHIKTRSTIHCQWLQICLEKLTGDDKLQKTLLLQMSTPPRKTQCVVCAVWGNERTDTQPPTSGISPPTSIHHKGGWGQNCLQKAKHKESRRAGLICPAVFHHCAEQLSPVFIDIFNTSLCQCAVPQCFKVSFLLYVPKSPKTTLLNDFRTVALTSVAMKAFESPGLLKTMHIPIDGSTHLPTELIGLLKMLSTQHSTAHCNP